jgi:anti-sigma regulatory factor (Ser/Thr protein kinase)
MDRTMTPVFSGTLSRRRSAEATIRLIVEKSGVFAFERFLDRIDFVLPSERLRLKLAACEIYDNLLRHAVPLVDGTAVIRVSRRNGTLSVGFHFKSPSFAAYSLRTGDHDPVFDRTSRRWHGMGLRMVRKLSTSLVFRAGELCDRVFIRF